VDAEHSGRRVRASLEGRVLADTGRCVAVFETGEPARFYVAPLDAAMNVLIDSGRRTWSPYLGEARWYSAALEGVVHPDVAWSYGDPIPECPKVAGLVCFDSKRVELAVDSPAEPFRTRGSTASPAARRRRGCPPSR